MPASVPAASRHCFEALPSKYSLHDPWDYPAPRHLSASITKFISTCFICLLCKSSLHGRQQDSAQGHVGVGGCISYCCHFGFGWNQGRTNLSPLTDSDVFKNQICNVWNIVFKREKLIYEDKVWRFYIQTRDFHIFSRGLPWGVMTYFSKAADPGKCSYMTVRHG